MRWSLSSSKTFRRCQRQWFFKMCLASPKAKDPVRRSAYLLGKLQSLAAWRGSLIDSVIAREVVPALQWGRAISTNAILAEARRLFDLQLVTARAHPLRQPDRTVASFGDSYAALHCVEYSDGPRDEELETTWGEIAAALTNLLGMTQLLDHLRQSSRLIAGRSLQFSCCGMTVQAVPDLIAFFPGRPPLLIDWKAHVTGTGDAWLQLAIYAIALTQCEPHKDFPSSPADWSPEALELLEVQLLLNRTRRHVLDEADVIDADAYIADSATSMLMALDGKKGSETRQDDFPTATFDGACNWCPFRKICWETVP